MKKVMAVSALFALGAMAESLTGVISDAKCGAAHEAKLNAACVKSCVKRGEAPVLVSGDKVYKISDDSKSKVMSHLGEKVTVDGTVNGDTVTIENIQTASG